MPAALRRERSALLLSRLSKIKCLHEHRLAGESVDFFLLCVCLYGALMVIDYQSIA